MCKDNRVTERVLEEGVLIDAEFPRNMDLAHKVLERVGYCEKHDFIHFSTNYKNQFTELKYLKTTPYIDQKTKESYDSRHFVLTVPDRYIPTSLEKETLALVIRTEQDIEKI